MDFDRARRSYVLALSRVPRGDLREPDQRRKMRLAEILAMLNDLGNELSVAANARTEWVGEMLRDAETLRLEYIARSAEALRRVDEINAARTPAQRASATWGGHPPPPVGGTA